MSDLIDDPRPGQNEPEYTVSEISGAVKRTIESGFARVRVRGEVGRVSNPRSGHIYLDLKDDRAVIAGVIWKGVAARLATRPEEGLEVVATGKLTTFPGQSKYQMVIDDIAPAGMGALMAMLEKRRTQLAGEGLFDPDRKKPLPYLPEVIGVVTSPSGAVIRDILHRLRDRFPRKVLVWPVAVQGAKCAPEVASAIRGFNQMTPGGALPRPDLIIVARGGGSLEDLWGFNEEEVVRAAADSDIPLISAVGHETDTTLIDFASDQRAPTPTAAAEMAVPVRLDLMAHLDAQGARLMNGLRQSVTQRRQRLGDLARALPRAETLLETPRQRVDRAVLQLGPGLHKAVQLKRLQLGQIAAPLQPQILRQDLRHRRKNLHEKGADLLPRLARVAMGKRETFDHVAPRLRPDSLRRDIAQKRQRLGDVSLRFTTMAQQQVDDHKTRLAALDKLRQTLGYKATLARGYAVVRNETGDLVTGVGAAAAATALEIEFHDGRHGMATDQKTPMAPAPEAPPKPPMTSKPVKPKKPKPTDPGQGSLF